MSKFSGATTLPNAKTHRTTLLDVKRSTHFSHSWRSRVSDSAVDESAPAITIRTSLAAPSSPTPLTSPPSSAKPKTIDTLRIGMRVSVESAGLIGTLRFLGATQFKPGSLWAGIQLDTSGGKNDGSVLGVRYFTCPDKHGIFVPATKVSVSSEITPPSPTTPIGMQPTPLQSKYSSRAPSQSPVRTKTSLSHLGKLQIASPLSATAIPSPVTTPTNLSTETATEFPLPTDRHPLAQGVRRDAAYESRIHALEDAIAHHIEEKEKYKIQFDTLRERFEPTEQALVQTQEELGRKNSLTSELKQATVETLEMLEGAQKIHKSETLALRQKIAQLEVERDDLRTAGLDAINAYESTIADLKHTHSAKDQQLHTDLDQCQHELQAQKNENQRLQLECESHARLQEELSQVTEQYQKAEKELSLLRSGVEQLEPLRTKVAQLEADNCALKRLQEEEAVSGAELVRVEMENMRLSDTHRKTEAECSRLMDEIQKSEIYIQELKQSAKEADRARRRESVTLNRDISRLESLIESKLFKEADLLDALQRERIQNHRLRAELTDARRSRGTGSDRWTMILSKCRSSLTPTLTSSATTVSEEEEEDDDDEAELYCEICEQAGHDLMSCAAVPNHRQSCQTGTPKTLLKSCT